MAVASVGIVMGSDSDLGTMEAAATALQEFGITYEMKVISAHRTPEILADYAKGARSRGMKTIIAGAGGAAQPPEPDGLADTKRRGGRAAWCISGSDVRLAIN